MDAIRVTYVCFLLKIFEKKYSLDFDVPQNGWGLRRFTLRSSNESLWRHEPLCEVLNRALKVLACEGQ